MTEEDFDKQEAFEKYQRELYTETLKEECAEVIQALTKINRFGLFSYNPANPEKSNRDNLIQEMGDVLAMVELVRTLPYFHISDEDLKAAKQKKMAKMQYWLNNPVRKAD